MICWRGVVAAGLLASMSAAHASDLMLAPGTSITIIDAQRPEQRIVISAPPGSALNLTRLMATAADSGISSLAIASQINSANRLRVESDGTISLMAPPEEPQGGTAAPAGGAILFDRGQFTVHANPEAALAAVPQPDLRAPSEPLLDHKKDPAAKPVRGFMGI